MCAALRAVVIGVTDWLDEGMNHEGHEVSRRKGIDEYLGDPFVSFVVMISSSMPA